MRSLSCLKYCVIALIINLIPVTGCFSEEPSKGRSQLLRQALDKALNHGGYRLLSISERGSQFAGAPKFVPLAEGLDDANAVPFLLKVIYEGPDSWDQNGLFSRPRTLYIARCYAVLSLAASGDPVAFSVLIGVLENPGRVTPADLPEYCNYLKVKYDIRGYAAAGLGILGDPNAVEPLVRMLRDKNPKVKYHCLWSLAKIGDLRTIKPILEAAVADEEIDGLLIDSCMQKMTKVRFTFDSSRKRKETTFIDFPELGPQKSGTAHYKKVWQHWFSIRKRWTEQEFKKRYERGREAKSYYRYTNRLPHLGIPALPLMIEEVQQGETALIPLISRLVDRELPEDATQQQCLAWWNKNKEKRLIPFEERKNQTGRGRISRE